MLDQIKALLKEAAAQKYVPTLGPKASDPVKTAIDKAKHANVKPQGSEGSKFQQITKKITAMHGSKPPITKIGEFMSSDVFVGAFLDEMDKQALWGRRLNKYVTGGLLTAAGITGLSNAGPIAERVGNTVSGTVSGLTKKVGPNRFVMPKLESQHDVNVRHAEQETGSMAKKMKETLARKKEQQAKEKSFPGSKIVSTRFSSPPPVKSSSLPNASLGHYGRK